MISSPGARADLERFAADLDRLRLTAGVTSLRALARRAHYSHTVIASAARGRTFPSLDVTLAFVRACDGNVEEWQSRWRKMYTTIKETEMSPIAAASPWSAQTVADGNDPMDAGCHVDAITVAVAKVSLAAQRHIIGQVELRYCERAHAAWGRFSGESGLDMIAMYRHDVDLTIGVVRESDGMRLGYRVEYGFDSHWGDLVITGEGAFLAWVAVRFDGAQVAYGETEPALLR